MYTYICRHVSPQHTHASQSQLGKPIQQQSFSLEDNLKIFVLYIKVDPATNVNFFLISHNNNFPSIIDGINILGLHQTRKPCQ